MKGTTRRGQTQKDVQVAWNRRVASPLEGEDIRRRDEGGCKKEHFILSPSPRALRNPLPQGTRDSKVEALNKDAFRAPLRSGFTLIELLVVVLIIGILAAVALPQYNKAVKKAQGREVLVAIDALDKAFKSYYLEHGDYGDKSTLPANQLDIGLSPLKNWVIRDPKGGFPYGPVPKSFLTGSTNPAICKGTTLVAGFESNARDAAVDVRWCSGKKIYQYCTKYSHAGFSEQNNCDKYFDCKQIQAGTGTEDCGF